MTLKETERLRKKAWVLLSILVRTEEKGVCCTCRKKMPWKKMQGGHFWHGKKYPVRYFDRRNVHCQCPGCNKFRKGNPREYAIYLVDRYGPDILRELRGLAMITPLPLSDFYENKIKEFSPREKK